MQIKYFLVKYMFCPHEKCFIFLLIKQIITNKQIREGSKVMMCGGEHKFKLCSKLLKGGVLWGGFVSNFILYISQMYYLSQYILKCLKICSNYLLIMKNSFYSHIYFVYFVLLLRVKCLIVSVLVCILSAFSFHMYLAFIYYNHNK